MAVMHEKNQIDVGRIYTHLLPLHIGKYLESDQISLFFKKPGARGCMETIFRGIAGQT